MSTIAQSPRSPEMVREEIRDLRAYLGGLPEEWRETGSFLSYEEKLTDLDRELALGRLLELASTLPKPVHSQMGAPSAGKAEDADRLAAILEVSKTRLTDLASTHARMSRFSNYATLIASAAAVASAALPLSVLVLPAAATAAVSAAAAAIFRWTERSREEARLAEHLMAIRNEVVHLNRPAGMNSEFEALNHSARVEALIAEVQKDMAQGARLR